MYAYKYVLILSSYAISSLALYFIMTWITMSLFTLDEESEKHILFSHLHGKVSYFIGKWIVSLVVMLPLLLFAIFYPIIIGSFKGNVSFDLFAFTFYSHIVFSAFGILVGTLFSATKLGTKKYTWLSAALIIFVSISTKSIIKIFPLLQWVLWVFPPVNKVIGYMDGDDQILFDVQFIFDGVFVIVYFMIGAIVSVSLFLKKES